METGLVIDKENSLSLISDKGLGEVLKPLKTEIYLFDSYIAGTTHLDDPSVLDEIGKGDKLILQREPDNRFDDNAILVLNKDKKKMGYIPEKDNSVFARLMDAGKYLYATVEGKDEEGWFTRIRVGIYLVDF